MLQINEFKPNLKIVVFSVREFSLGKFSKYLIIQCLRVDFSKLCHRQMEFNHVTGKISLINKDLDLTKGTKHFCAKFSYG